MQMDNADFKIMANFDEINRSYRAQACYLMNLKVMEINRKLLKEGVKYTHCELGKIRDEKPY